MLRCAALALLAGRAGGAAAPRWRNGTEGVRAFLTFDSKASAESVEAYSRPSGDGVWWSWLRPSRGRAQPKRRSYARARGPARYADRVDFVWGGSETQLPRWRNSSNPDVVVSYYAPFTRDPAPQKHQRNGSGLPRSGR